MNAVISKELFYQVWPVLSSEEVIINGAYISVYSSAICDGYTINIYELAYKCKEWALKNGYSISSTIEQDENKVYANAFVFDGAISGNDVNADTEPGAIFKACQWILENKDKK